MDSKAEMEKIANIKAEVISLIANSKCFIVITDDGKTGERRMMLNNPGTALFFLGEMEKCKYDIMYPKIQTPPPSNIIK